MSILALDTTKKQAFIAVENNGESNFYNTEKNQPHSENLLVKIDEVLQNENLNIKDVNTFGVAIGPGSFTGIRIGVSVVKAFMFNTNKKCIAVNSFELGAYSINSKDYENGFLMAFNADNRGCYVAHFHKNKNIQSMQVLTLANLNELIKEKKLPLIIKQQDKEYFSNVEGEKRLINIEHKHFINLLLDKQANNDYIQINELEPLYIKLSQAESQFRKKMLTNLKIEKAFESDFKELETLEKNIFKDNAYVGKSLKQELTESNRLILLAKLNDETIAYINVLKTPDNMLNILKIAVKPVYRRLGVATKLLEELQEFKQSNKFNKIFLEVSDNNKQAIKFYKKFGFTEKDKRKKYYKDGSNAIIMFK